MASFATNWRDLSGENEWKDLLDPLDNVLRRYLLHYGERAGAAGLGFIYEPKSKNFGLPRYAKRTFFSKVGLELGNPYKYVVTKYLYATHSGKSYFLAYVAVSTDEGTTVLGRRDILISWRGTMTEDEKSIDLSTDLAPAPDILGNENTEAKVHSGWLNYYTDADPSTPHNEKSCQSQVLDAVRELVDKYNNDEISITVTGHSMGAALATLNATDIVNNGYNIPTNEPAEKACLVTAIVIASPRLGNPAFKEVLSGLENIHILRVTNENDPVPNFPLDIMGYVPVGEELRINSLDSPYLKPPEDLLKLQYTHDLEIYLHVVAGTQGTNSNEFKPEGYRDLALVNKSSDALKDDLNIVDKWWTEKNKSMVQGDDGSWVLDDHEKDDD